MYNNYKNTRLKLLKTNAGVWFIINILIENFITYSCIRNTCVTWQGIDYKLPEDDTIVSKHVGV
jgi:hypothetical protein